MALLDLLGRRWALRVIWELRDSPKSFRGLQTSCGNMSSSVLNQRLAELREAGVLAGTPAGFALTEEGVKLLDAFPPYQAWAERWARRVRALDDAEQVADAEVQVKSESSGTVRSSSVGAGERAVDALDHVAAD